MTFLKQVLVVTALMTLVQLVVPVTDGQRIVWTLTGLVASWICDAFDAEST